jgi:NodT family efflux transporter outer membrane factor (OMF) lipoprotein
MTRHRFTAGSLCLSMALGACAVKQPPPPDASLGSILPPTTVVPAAWRASGGLPAVVNTDWVRTFSDPQLDALVDEALQNNLDLRAAGARVELAYALVTQARSLLFPQLTIYASTGVVGRDTTHERNGLAGEISWELDLWGRVRAQTASAAAASDAAEADLLYARQSLAAIVATLWYQTIAADRLRRTAEEASMVYDEQLRLVGTKRRIGHGTDQEIALTSADLNRARHRERLYATSLQQTVRGLEVVVGRYPAAELAIAADLPAVPPPIPAGLPSELLARRPDLVAAERRVAAAFHSIQVAETARLPRIVLTAAGGRSTSDLLRLAGVGAGFWKAGIDLMAPIFTGGNIDAEIRAATAEQEAALALFGQTALRAFSEVESALAGEGLLDDQQRYLEAVLKQDTEALRLGRVRYRVGSTDLLDVLQLQSRQLNTQFELIGVRNDRLANRVALHLALGGGFTPPPVTP